MTVQLFVPKTSTNTSSMNNSKSLRVVTISSSVLNFGLFAHSATFIPRFAHFISKTVGFGWFFLNYSLLANLILSILLQSYRITELQPLLTSD